MAVASVRRAPHSLLVLAALLAWGCSSGGSSSSQPGPPGGPGAPAAPVASAVAGDQQVTVSWGPVDRAVSYNLYWSTSPLPARSAWTRVQGVASPHVVSGLPNDVPFAVVVTAVSSEGLESADSLQALATPRFPYAPPPAPAAVPRTGSVVITAPPPPQPYVRLDLYWSTAPGVTKATGTRIENVSSCPSCAVSYEQTGLERGRTYHYVLVGVLGDGRSSAESAEVSATVPFTTTFARLGPDGARSWSHGVNDAVGTAVAARPDGSFYVVGLTHGPATFGAGEPNETTLQPSLSSGLLFVARYSADGLLSWVRGSDGALVGGRDGTAVAAAVLADGSVAVTGSYSGNLTLAPGAPGQTTLTQLSPVADVFVARFLADGTLAWARGAGGTSYPSSGGHEGRAAVGLSDGSVVVTGSFFGTITFPGTPDVTLTTTAGCNTNDFDVFVARYDASGTLSWARRAGGCSWEEGLGIAAGPLDAVTVTGRFSSRPAVFGPGEPGETSLSAALLDYVTYDVFVARYRADGSLAWADRAGGTAEDLGESIAATGGGVAVAGELYGPADFGSGTAAAASLPQGAFLARWSDAGTFSWARSIGVGGGVAVAPAPGGEAWLVGTLPAPPASLVLGAGEPGQSTLLASYVDLFAARYGADGSLVAAAMLDRGPQVARGAAGLPDGSVIVLGNVPPF